MAENMDIKKKLATDFIQRFPRDAAPILNHLQPGELQQYLSDQPLNVVKDIILSLSPDVISGLLEVMDDNLFKELFSSLDPYTGAILLSRLKPELMRARLKQLPKRKLQAIEELLAYPHDSAGYLMDTQIVTFYPTSSVEEVLHKLRNIGDRRMSTIYVTDETGKLEGKISLHIVAISAPTKLLADLIEPAPSVQVMTPQGDVVALFQEIKTISLPVVDLSNKLLGIIRNDALIEATQKDATEAVLAMFGAGREERALSTPWFAIRKRLPWLEINLATAFLAATVVGIFEDTIARITVLAVFLPVVAGQSGNTGSQALAVTMRGLALREIQTNHWWKVARKEIVIGFVNGVAVALTTSAIVYFWADSSGLALVIGTSMVISMVIAGFSGAVVPIILKSFGQDPAQSSSIVLTTVTDIVGFLSFLGLATWLGSALDII